ncbi:MAG: hypothetical protein LAP85_17615 [Acidobacteriia bacterium]|nr:hypothetical protein [Terriglobia bacterium]
MKKLCIIAVAAGWLVAASPQAREVRASAQEIDRLLAAVNGRVITEWDLRLARTLNAILELGRNVAPQSRQKELDRLINQELIRQEMENFPIGQADRNNLQVEIQDKMTGLKNAYAEIGGLPALLRQLGLQEDELVSYIDLIALTEKFSNLRFGPFVTVSDAEVEAYYGEKLLPVLKKSGLAPPPMAEVAATITDTVKQEKISSAMDQWIENIRNHSHIEIFGNAPRLPEKERS